MHVDQSRQQRHAFKVDMARAGRHGGGLTDRRDAPVDDGDLRVIDDSSRQHIDHPVGADHDSIGEGWRQCGNAEHCAGNDGGALKKTRSHAHPLFNFEQRYHNMGAAGSTSDNNT